MKQGQRVSFLAGNVAIDYVPSVPTENHKYTINKQFNNVTFKDVKRQGCTLRRNVSGVNLNERLLEILIDKHPDFNISLTQQQVQDLLPILQRFAQTGKL